MTLPPPWGRYPYSRGLQVCGCGSSWGTPHPHLEPEAHSTLSTIYQDPPFRPCRCRGPGSPIPVCPPPEDQPGSLCHPAGQPHLLRSPAASPPAAGTFPPSSFQAVCVLFGVSAYVSSVLGACGRGQVATPPEPTLPRGRSLIHFTSMWSLRLFQARFCKSSHSTLSGTPGQVPQVRTLRLSWSHALSGVKSESANDARTACRNREGMARAPGQGRIGCPSPGPCFGE